MKKGDKLTLSWPGFQIYIDGQEVQIFPTYSKFSKKITKPVQNQYCFLCIFLESFGKFRNCHLENVLSKQNKIPQTI